MDHQIRDRRTHLRQLPVQLLQLAQELPLDVLLRVEQVGLGVCCVACMWWFVVVEREGPLVGLVYPYVLS